jgi:hypothetical protein
MDSSPPTARALRAGAIAAVSLLAALASVARAGEGLAGESRNEYGGVDQSEPSCALTTTTTHHPTRLAVGETVQVTHTARSACVPKTFELVLVIDASTDAASMEDMLVWAQDIALAISSLPRGRVGVVAFASDAEIRCDMTSDPAVLLACIADISPAAGRRPEAGIALAGKLLRGAADRNPNRSETYEIVVLMMGGPPDTSCEDGVAAARALSGQGVLIVSTVHCTECDESCARRMATSPRYYFESWPRFTSWFRDFPQPSEVMNTEITATLAVSVSWASSPAPIPDVRNGALAWHFDLPVPNPVTVTYRVYAHLPGTYSVADGGILNTYSGFGSFPGRTAFPSAIVEVIGYVTRFEAWLPLVLNGQ